MRHPSMPGAFDFDHHSRTGVGALLTGPSGSSWTGHFLAGDGRLSRIFCLLKFTRLLISTEKWPGQGVNFR
jgi:hypothetical protein